MHPALCTQPQVCYRHSEARERSAPELALCRISPHRSILCFVPYCISLSCKQRCLGKQAEPRLARAAEHVHRDFWPSSLLARARGTCLCPAEVQGTISCSRNAAIKRLLPATLEAADHSLLAACLRASKYCT